MKPFKVVCLISGKLWISEIKGCVGIGPDKGEVCTVLEERYNSETMKKEYILQEYHGVPGDEGYDAKWFVPLINDFQAITFEKTKEYETI